MFSGLNFAAGDGTLSPIAKLADGGFHVVDEIVVVHEAAMAAAVNNIKHLLTVCGDRLVIIVCTPLPRYLNLSCCDDVSHCIHRLIPDFAYKLLDDRQRLHQFGKLSSFPRVSPGCLRWVGGPAWECGLLYQDGPLPG